MGIRFHKSIRLGKYFRINLSKNGVGYSFGGKGVRHTVSPSGKSYNTYSIPGTGISYRSQTSEGRKSSAAPSSRSQPVSTAPGKKKNILKIIGIVFAALIGLSAIASFFPDSEAEETVPEANPVQTAEELPVSRAIPAEEEESAAPYFESTDTLLLAVGESAELRIFVQDPSEAARLALSVTDESVISVKAHPDGSSVVLRAEALAPGYANITASLPDGTETPDSVQIVVEEGSVPTESAPAPVEYLVINTDSKKIHRPGCSYAPDQDSPNRDAIVSGTENALLDSGYTWCGHCH